MEGKDLLEALLYAREDNKITTKPYYRHIRFAGNSYLHIIFISFSPNFAYCKRQFPFVDAP